jgi:hypothetical protein
MNERIKELAKQSGLIQYDTDSKMSDVYKFAELVRADEREACAVLCETDLAQNDGITCAEEIRRRG